MYFSASLTVNIIEHKRYYNRPVDNPMCRSVGVSVGPESIPCQNGRLDLDAVWSGEWGRSRDGCIR